MRIIGIIILGAFALIFGRYGLEYLEKGNRSCSGIECAATDFCKDVGTVLIVISIGFDIIFVVGLLKVVKTKKEPDHN